MADTLRIVVGSDCAGIRYKDVLAEQLRNDDRVSEVIDVGRDIDEDTHYPHIAVAAARLIQEGKASTSGRTRSPRSATTRPRCWPRPPFGCDETPAGSS